ncbi:MAG: hypothetical protein H6719_21805 [Sandaracinaceae bacterium]|nr:hypothetical protein [Sandaracinaceae bacterium]
MGPLRSIKVRGLRGLGRLDLRLDGSSLVILGPSGSGKTTLLEGIASELGAELEGRPHPALDIQAVGGADQQLRIAFVSRPVQLRWERDFVGEWGRGVALAVHLDEGRNGTRARGPLDSPLAPTARVGSWLPAVLCERHARGRGAPDPMEGRVHEAWLQSMQEMLRSLLGAPTARLSFHEGACALDLGDGRRPRFDELSRGHRTAIDLFAEVALRVEAARARPEKPALDPPGLVLVDGLERDLDARLQGTLLSLLEARYPNVQWVFTTHSPLTAVGLSDAVVIDVGRGELRRTPTLRAEGLDKLAARMAGAPAAASPPARPSAPPPLPRRSAPPPPAVLPARGRRTTTPGAPFNDD